jgi:hypothetical protein
MLSLKNQIYKPLKKISKKMYTHWNDTNYGNDLKLTIQDADSCSHSGPCDDDVNRIMTKQYIKKQLSLLNPEKLAKELKEYGAWDEIELSNHNENLMRWVWISAEDISERVFFKHLIKMPKRYFKNTQINNF